MDISLKAIFDEMYMPNTLETLGPGYIIYLFSFFISLKDEPIPYCAVFPTNYQVQLYRPSVFYESLF